MVDDQIAQSIAALKAEVVRLVLFESKKIPGSPDETELRQDLADRIANIVSAGLEKAMTPVQNKLDADARQFDAILAKLGGMNPDVDLTPITRSLDRLEKKIAELKLQPVLPGAIERPSDPIDGNDDDIDDAATEAPEAGSAQVQATGHEIRRNIAPPGKGRPRAQWWPWPRAVKSRDVRSGDAEAEAAEADRGSAKPAQDEINVLKVVAVTLIVILIVAAAAVWMTQPADRGGSVPSQAFTQADLVRLAMSVEEADKDLEALSAAPAFNRIFAAPPAGQNIEIARDKAATAAIGKLGPAERAALAAQVNATSDLLDRIQTMLTSPTAASWKSALGDDDLEAVRTLASRLRPPGSQKTDAATSPADEVAADDQHKILADMPQVIDRLRQKLGTAKDTLIAGGRSSK